MKKIIYYTSNAITEEPYTFPFVCQVLKHSIKNKYTPLIITKDSKKTIKEQFLVLFTNYEKTQIQIKKEFTELVLNKDDIIIFSGSIDYCRILFKKLNTLKNKKVFWYQGIESEESYLKHKSKCRKYLILLFEVIAILGSDLTVVPSMKMKEYLVKRLGKIIHNKIKVIPNLVEPSRVNITEIRESRKKIRNPKLVIGYMGGLSVWQCFEKTCDIYKEIAEQIDDCHFFVITKEAEKAKKIISSKNIRNYTISSVKSHEVEKYLECIDIGMLIREKHIVNEVSCPMKWLEYMRKGIPVITTNAVNIIKNSEENIYNLIIENENSENRIKDIAKYLSYYCENKEEISTKLIEAANDKWTFAMWEKEYLEIINI